jgi:enhancer of polycomb-like protein
MAKASSRGFRSRKINPRTRILVRSGYDAVGIEDDALPEGEAVELDDPTNPKLAGAGADTRGVDKSEEFEHHLQAVLNHASASRSTNPSPAPGSSPASRADGRTSLPSPLSPVATVVKAFIPTPETFARLSPKGAWTSPYSYIRFSDTVEDCLRGAVEYTMDEDDEDWLEEFNASVARGRAGEEEHDARRDRKGKGRASSGEERGTRISRISEDEFELVMETFERETERRAPMAHVVSSIIDSPVSGRES